MIQNMSHWKTQRQIKWRGWNKDVTNVKSCILHDFDNYDYVKEKLMP